MDALDREALESNWQGEDAIDREALDPIWFDEYYENFDKDEKKC